MNKGFFKISGVGVRPAGKSGMVVRVRFENGDVVTFTGKQVRCLNSLARIISKPTRSQRRTVPGGTIKMN